MTHYTIDYASLGAGTQAAHEQALADTMDYLRHCANAQVSEGESDV